jgi:hypothetical protein
MFADIGKRADQSPGMRAWGSLITKLCLLTGGDSAMRSFLAIVVAGQNCFFATEIGFVGGQTTKPPHVRVN